MDPGGTGQGRRLTLVARDQWLRGTSIETARPEGLRTMQKV